MVSAASRETPDLLPLVIDLDGTLIRTDLLHESVLKLLRKRPYMLLALPVWLARGKAHLKRRIAEQVDVDVKGLPYDTDVIALIESARAAGRRTVLCTASDAAYANAVAAHLGLFDEVIASDGVTNVSAHRKAERLVQRFGESGFDYAGNAPDDLHVWRHARHAIVVDAPDAVLQEARRSARVERVLPRPRPSLANWLHALRLHQWLKNLLVLLPLAGSFQFGDWLLVQQALLAFVAFGLCASSVYVVNDLMDLESDRMHPRKRLRPFASGQLSPVQGLLAAATLLLLSGAIAWAGRPAFPAWLGMYFATTLAYTFFLKQRVLIDCIALGGLYTLRIVAGSAAVGLAPSFWLLAFSLFLFLSLAFVKRYSELAMLAKAGRSDAQGRGYLATDLPLVQSMGIASGFTSVLVLALYINGDTVLKLYTHPEMLWLTIPVHLYWVSRMWMQAQRGHMHDDPIVFAVRDRYSLACGALFAAAMLAAR